MSGCPSRRTPAKSLHLRSSSPLEASVTDNPNLCLHVPVLAPPPLGYQRLLGRPGPSPWWPWARLAAAGPATRLPQLSRVRNRSAASPLLLPTARCRPGRHTRGITLWWLNENMALRRRQKKSSAWAVAFVDGRRGRWLAGHVPPSVPILTVCSKQWWGREVGWRAASVPKARPWPGKEQ